MFYDHFYEWDSDIRDAIIALVSSSSPTLIPLTHSHLAVSRFRKQKEMLEVELQSGIAYRNGGMSSPCEVRDGLKKEVMG